MKIRTLLLYGVFLGLALVVLSLADSAVGTEFLQGSAYGGIVGIIFLLLGLWLGNWGNTRKKAVQTIDASSAGNPIASVDRVGEGIELSDRETEVLKCLAEGMTNKEIAGQLFISENTVKTHLQNLYSKLEVSRRTQAVAKGRTVGIL